MNQDDSGRQAQVHFIRVHVEFSSNFAESKYVRQIDQFMSVNKRIEFEPNWIPLDGTNSSHVAAELNRAEQRSESVYNHKK